MPLKFNSVLRRHDTMDPRRVDGIIKATIDLCVQTAHELVGGGDYIVRSLHPGDVPPTGTTQRLWNETTGTATDQFITAAIGDGTAINDDTVIGIYGCRFLFTEIPSYAPASTLARRPPITALRLVVGGTRVAEWDLYTIFTAAQVRGANSSIVTNTMDSVSVRYPVGIAESPVLVKPRTTLLVQFYEVTTVAVDFSMQLLGVVVEKTGSGDGLNP